MALWRDIGGEIAKALAVLALVFLSFAHQPVAVAQPIDGAEWTAAVDLSFCGGSPDGEAGHFPCHACRVGVADLPAPSCVAEPAYRAFAEAEFEFRDETIAPQRAISAAHARAPPALV